MSKGARTVGFFCVDIFRDFCGVRNCLQAVLGCSVSCWVLLYMPFLNEFQIKCSNVFQAQSSEVSRKSYTTDLLLGVRGLQMLF